METLIKIVMCCWTHCGQNFQLRLDGRGLYKEQRITCLRCRLTYWLGCRIFRIKIFIVPASCGARLPNWCCCPNSKPNVLIYFLLSEPISSRRLSWTKYPPFRNCWCLRTTVNKTLSLCLRRYGLVSSQLWFNLKQVQS